MCWVPPKYCKYVDLKGVKDQGYREKWWGKDYKESREEDGGV